MDSTTQGDNNNPSDPNPSVPQTPPTTSSPFASAPVAPAEPMSSFGSIGDQNTAPGGFMGGNPAGDPTGFEPPQAVTSSPAPTWPSIPPSDFGQMGQMPQVPVTPTEQPMPTFVPPTLPVDNPVIPSGQPSWSAMSGTIDTTAPAGGLSESVPTDLSHLVSGTDIAAPAPAPSPMSLESLMPAGVLVAPAPGAITPGQPSQPVNVGQGAAAQTVASGASRGFPKILIIVGVVALLIVLAASAYFILGVGQQNSQQTSAPAEQPPLTNPPAVIVPSPVVSPALPVTPAATSSAGFGDLQGVTPAPATNSGAPAGTSALELLRQRQGQ